MSPEPALDLSPRLAAIAELVAEGAPALSPVEMRVADIGCDHGLLARHLAASERCGLCVATEVDEVVLFRARRAAATDSRAWPERSRRAARISWRSGFGLEPLDVADRIDTIVLAGLGAATIIHILDSPRLDALAPRRLVVQPQTSPAQLRGWLVGHGWAVVAETVARDRGRCYEIAAAEPGDGEAALSHPTLTRDDMLAVGPVLLRTAGDRLIELWEERRARLERIVAIGASGAMAQLAAREAARARRILEALRAGAAISRGE